MICVACGTEKPETAKREILAQWEKMKQGAFSKETLKRAIKDAMQGYADSLGTPQSIEDYYSLEIVGVDIQDPSFCVAFLKTVTREQVIECAKSWETDTLLLMKGKHYEPQSDL